MSDARPGDPEIEPDEPAGPCRSCGSATSAAQRYCLSCGELVGARRLDPLAQLARREGPVLAPPTAAAAARAVPVAAAAAAIVVAGLAGSLVAGGGGGARAAVITRPALAAVAPPAASSTAATPAPAPDSSSDSGSTTTADATADASAPVTDDAAAAAPAPAADEPAADSSGDDGGSTSSTPDDEKIPPHVWLLALDGPRAQEAVDRIADQGVRLTGVRPVAADTIGNATTLLTGALPAAAPAPGTEAPAPTASLPEELTTAKQTWRSYVDAQPGTGDPLPGLCADPPAGDAAAAVLAGRSPFGRIAALRTDDACGKGTSSLEALGNDVSSGDSLPSFSYATLGGCAPPDRTVVALPDQVSDTVTAITESTEFQESGVLIVTTVGAADPCPAAPAASRQAVVPSGTDATTVAPAATAAPTAAAPAPVTPTAPVATPTGATGPTGAALPPTPTVVLRANAKPGSTLDVATDLRSLTRLAATTLGVDPPGTSGADDVSVLDLPAAKKR